MAYSASYNISLNDNFSKTLKGIENNLKGFDSKIAGIQNKVSSNGLGFGSLASLATKAFGAITIFDTVKGIVTMGSDMEQTRVAFTTFLGSAEKANKVIAELNNFANVTPFDNDQVIKAGKGLLAFGVQADELQATLKSIGDVSSATGKDFNELATIYGKAKIAGTLYAEDINQLVEAGVPIIGEFAKQLGVSESQVKKMASEGKVSFSMLEKGFQNLTNEGGQFANLMDKQSKTLGGRWSSLIGTLQTVGVGIGESLIEPLGKVVDTFAYVVSWVTEHVDNLKRIFAPVIKALEPVIEAFQRLGDKIGASGDKGEFLESVFNTIGNIIIFLEPILTTIGELIGSIIDLFVQVGETLYNFVKQNEWVQKILMGLYTGVVAVFKKIAEAAKDILGGVGNLLQGIFTLDTEKIKEGLVGLAKGFKANPINLAMEGAKGFNEGYQKGFTGTDFFAKKDKADLTDEQKAVLKDENKRLDTANKDKDKSKALKDAKETSVKGIQSSKPTTVNITIENLVKEFIVSTTNLSESKQAIKDKVLEALLTAVNDINIQQGT